MEEIIKDALLENSRRARRPHRGQTWQHQNQRPAFQSVELDPIDARLEAKAAEKGIPTLVAPKAEGTPAGRAERRRSRRSRGSALEQRPLGRHPKQATPRSRMKGLKIELPDYVWVALKKREAEEMVSLKHIIMTALRDKGSPSMMPT